LVGISAATTATALATAAATTEEPTAPRIALEGHDFFNLGLQGLHFLVGNAEVLLQLVHHALAELLEVTALAALATAATTTAVVAEATALATLATTTTAAAAAAATIVSGGATGTTSGAAALVLGEGRQRHRADHQRRHE
jgi:hypothetical protein